MGNLRWNNQGPEGYYLVLLPCKFFAFMGQNSKQFSEGSNSGSRPFIILIRNTDTGFPVGL